MFDRAVEAFKRVNAPGLPENSISYRFFVFLTVACGILSIYAEEGYSPLAEGLGLAGIALGNWLSWERRGKRNYLLKFILSNLLLLAFIMYLQELFRTSYDPRVPLAKLFLWILILHSFDLPARKDLRFSLVSALIMVAMAGAFSISLKLLPFMLAFVAFGSVSLFLDHLSELDITVSRGATREYPGFRKLLPASLLLIGLLVAVTFIFMPRPEGLKIRTFPTAASEEEAIPDFVGQIVNPALPFLKGSSRKNLSGYFGFSPYLDLNFRGRLSEDIVFVVRTSSPNFYRGLVFNQYDGSGWKLDESKPKEITAASPPFLIDWETPTPQFTEELVQTYYIVREQPNIIYAPYQADILYFPSFSFWEDKYLGLRSPFLLSEGMVYTVVSRVPVEDPLRLEKLGLGVSPKDMPQSLVLPEGFPERVVRLAHQITRGKTGQYEKVRAIQAYLETNYKYDLDIPAFPKGKDVVDYFLFEAQKGYCEHFASAFVVLCRSVGIPARLVTGFAQGDYNFVTGYYDVKVKDAHAWSEVFFPVYGWLSFNPTPGFEEPVTFEGNPGALESILLSIKSGRNPVSAWLKKSGLYRIGGLAARLKDIMPWIFAAGLILSATALTFLLLKVTGRRRALREKYSGLAYYYDILLRRMEQAGFKPEERQTPREIAGMFRARYQEKGMDDFVSLLELELYSGKRLTPEEKEQAKNKFESVTLLLGSTTE